MAGLILARGEAGAPAAATEDGRVCTYGELSSYADGIAQAAGGRTLVFCLCTNSLGALAGYAAFLGSGIVPLMLSAKLDRQLLGQLVSSYRPQFLWVPQQEAEGFAQYREAYRSCGYALLRTGLTPPPMHEDLALLLTTSGSTGSPKLVRQSYRNIESNTKSIIQYLEIDKTERAATTLPMNYTYGLSVINTHLYAGAALLLTEKTLMQKEFWEFFKREEATSFAGVPYTYEMLKKLRFFRMDLPSLRYMTQAGGKLSPALHKEFAEHAKETGRKFIVMYGQTEATARMAYLPAEKALEKYGSMGIAVPGGKFELADVHGRIIQEAEAEGELIYYGDNVTLGYAENGQDLAGGDDRHGRLETGDMAKRDADGFYYITGRKKRFLKIYGNRVNLDEAERLIREAFADAECACAGADDRMDVYVAQGSYTEAEREGIRRHLAEKTGLHAGAFRIVPVPEIPKNEAGKILYAKLEEKG